MHLIAFPESPFLSSSYWCRLLQIVQNSPSFGGPIYSSVCQNNGFLGTLVILAICGLFFRLSEPNPGPDGTQDILDQKTKKYPQTPFYNSITKKKEA
jgi:hypothetical protein